MHIENVLKFQSEDDGIFGPITYHPRKPIMSKGNNDDSDNDRFVGDMWSGLIPPHCI